MDKTKIQDIIQKQRSYFATGQTKDLSFRLEQLKRLKRVLIENERAVFDALQKDLHKPAVEAYGGDLAIVIREIDYAVKHLRSWARPKRVKTPFVYLFGSSRVHPEPYGVALIIGPWNFPVQLMLAPLVGAMAAGNCAVLKPSELSPETSSILEVLIGENFDPAYISVIEGGAEAAQMLLEEKFDYLFYTGGSMVGKIVMQAAAKHLTPVTLELGGKNPCIVDLDVDLEYAARRIAWGKFYNAGQNCSAPDYLLVDKRVKGELLERMKKYIRKFYGDDPSKSPDYARIVNEKHFDRLVRLLGHGKIIAGGETDRTDRYIAPTILDGISPDDPVMNEEIFGPILPVIEYEDLPQAIAVVNARQKPLALYFFSRSRERQERVLRETSSGGGCINDTVIHYTVTALPSGGVGMSGMGKYHGKASFDTFSHFKSIVKRGRLFDFNLRYPPYKNKLKIIKKLF